MRYYINFQYFTFRGPIGDTEGVNYILNMYNFLTATPILDIKVSLDRPYQDLIKIKISDKFLGFSMVFGLFSPILSNTCIFPSKEALRGTYKSNEGEGRTD